VPGRSAKVYADWLDQRGETFRTHIAVATLDPFHGYKNAIDDQLRMPWRSSTLPRRQARHPSTR